MLPDASKNSVEITVYCDICREQMEESTGAAPAWLCYPCNNLIYESELWRFDSCVLVKEPANATSGD